MTETVRSSRKNALKIPRCRIIIGDPRGFVLICSRRSIRLDGRCVSEGQHNTAQRYIKAQRLHSAHRVDFLSNDREIEIDRVETSCNDDVCLVVEEYIGPRRPIGRDRDGGAGRLAIPVAAAVRGALERSQTPG